ncbi:MAG: endolytic transglycosylase MltG, partial [Tabrizicola sp.]
PTPIANPGAEAIKAAVNPDSTDYLFFVADGSGEHAFAETLDEHNKNVAAWRKIEAAQGAGEEGGVQSE